jgi:putative hydrolase of the HAD superfamily
MDLIRAVIFDFDGLILDTETPWYMAYRHVFNQYGVDLTLEYWGRTIGTSFNLDEVVRDLEAQSGRTVDRDHLNRETKQIYSRLMQEQSIRPGVLRYLSQAKELGLSIGLASSSRLVWIEPYLNKFDLYKYFDTIVTAERVTRVKPDPELYLTALQDLGIDGQKALAFEDSLHGLRAAKAANLHCVIVPNEVTSQMNFEQYDLRLSSMEELELAEVVKRISSQESGYLPE